MTSTPRLQVRLEVVPHLDDHELRRLSVLLEHAVEADGVRPLSEHVSLHLRDGGDRGSRHLLAYVAPEHGAASSLAGYLHLDVTDHVGGASAELAVDPAHRGHGVGALLVRQALAESPDQALRLWAHGDLPAARALALRLGFTRVRSLWLMRRPLLAPIRVSPLPPGYSLRDFRPGEDDDAWLALNARAFAGHPEQERWSDHDLQQRMAEPWFDPAGFLLAVGPDGELAGYHWTKVHGRREHGHEPLGEVYIVGVDPDRRGSGLGRALVLAGLAHLQAAGLREACLYVDASNAAAVGLYGRLGFVRGDTDVSYARDVPPTP